MNPVPPTNPRERSGRRRERIVRPFVERDIYAGKEMKNVIQHNTPSTRAIVISVLVNTRLRYDTASKSVSLLIEEGGAVIAEEVGIDIPVNVCVV